MNRFLLAGIATVCLAPMTARAQIPTVDAAAITQLLNQIEQMKQEVAATRGVFASLIRQIDPNGMATNLIGQQPLPGAGQISQILSGGGGFGSASGLANQFLKSNTAYTPQSRGQDDFNAGFLTRNGNTVAGTEAMAQEGIQAMQTHIAGLSQIQQELSTVKTEADVAAIQARLQAEQANIEAQNAQMTSLGLLAAAQDRAYTQQLLQRGREFGDQKEAYYTGSGGSGFTTSTTPVAYNSVPTFNAGP